MAQNSSELGFERVVFFSDAVFAIVITLLVLEIRLPQIEPWTDAALNQALLELLPKYIGFVASFLIIGLVWSDHHRIFCYIHQFTGGLIWRNLLLLLCVSFIPFPTAVFSEYYSSRTAFILYTATFASVGLAKLWVWQYAVATPGLVDAEPLTTKRISRRSWAQPLGCVIAILVSFVSIQLAPFFLLTIPLLARWLDPTHRSRVDV